MSTSSLTTPSRPAAAARIAPLKIRPGARYTCFADGLCCTDIHALGPLTRSEARELRQIERAAVRYYPEFKAPMMATLPSGGCFYQRADQLCQLHASRGMMAKPEGCRRFPLGLVATPSGGRVTTSHRCPCRTLGERPALVGEQVTPSLRDRSGRLSAERRVEGKITLHRSRRLSFEAWEALEKAWMHRLLAAAAAKRGVPPLSSFFVLAPQSLPLRSLSWAEALESLDDAFDGTQFGMAARWFARALAPLLGLRMPKKPLTRPWEAAFARALGRTPQAESPRVMLADWMADHLWSLEWTERGSLLRACADGALRLGVAQRLSKRLEGLGMRADAATAEALMIVDLVGNAEYWTDIVEALALDPLAPSFVQGFQKVARVD